MSADHSDRRRLASAYRRAVRRGNGALASELATVYALRYRGAVR